MVSADSDIGTEIHREASPPYEWQDVRVAPGFKEVSYVGFRARNVFRNLWNL